jgi:hypothetical protein
MMLHGILRRLVVILPLAATAQTPVKQAETPDRKEIREYRLNMDVIQRYLGAFKAISNDAAVKKCFNNDAPGNAPTLDTGEKRLSGCPAAVAILKPAGLKPREFMVITGALFSDFIAVGMKREGKLKEYPSTISAENAAFIDQNFDKLQALIAPISKAK